MNFSEEYWWKVALELKLRKVSGDAFQSFFSDLMGKLHGDDFVKVRPFGSKGDKGCDGYLLSSGKLYQCYGALNGDKSKVDYLISKMEEDFAKAKEKLGDIMTEWHMVHNLVDGLPIDAVEKLQELVKNNPEIHFGFIGFEGFEQRVGLLDQQQKTSLLGPIATNQDGMALQVEEIKNLIDDVVHSTNDGIAPQADIGPVPVDKLTANDLPVHWQQLISGGWQNSHIVADYIDRRPEPMLGENLAKLLSDRYQYLKSQSLPPAAIMDGLYEYITGAGSVQPARQVAAQSLLAYFFESCDIFENVSLAGDQ